MISVDLITQARCLQHFTAIVATAFLSLKHWLNVGSSERICGAPLRNKTLLLPDATVLRPNGWSEGPIVRGRHSQSARRRFLIFSVLASEMVGRIGYRLLAVVANADLENVLEQLGAQGIRVMSDEPPQPEV